MRLPIYLFAVLVTIFCIQPVLAQQVITTVSYVQNGGKGVDLIYYQPSQKLSWQDFKGTPHVSGSTAAITNAGMGFQMQYSKRNGVANLQIFVNCNFDRTSSWVKPDAKTAYILAHEQHHFDIAYWVTRQFMEALRKVQFTQLDYANQIKEVYYRYQQKMNDLQEAYDAATNNSLNTTQQEKWNQKIETALQSLEKN